MPLDALVTGRIATLAGSSGFGWVEAIGIREGRIAFAGSEVDLETRADPHTLRFALEPDEVAIPGLTDAHLHLTEAALALTRVDLSATATLDEGVERVRAANAALADPDTWIEGYGWHPDRWGRWPTADDLEGAAPGRRLMLWAHDHHTLAISHAGLRSAGITATTQDPAGGVIGRGPNGQPNGLLYESATSLVSVLLPPPDEATLEAAIGTVGRDLLALGVVACHDPGVDLGVGHAVYARLSDRGRLPLRVHVGLRPEDLEVAIEEGWRSGRTIGERPDARAAAGWLKLFADGTLGSRTAALLEDIEPEPDRPLAADRRRGVWNTPPEALSDLARRAAMAGIATHIHAIGDAAVRAALDALEPTVADVPFMPRVEHVQLLDAADLGRFAANGIAASVQPGHLRSDAPTARRLWGERAETNGYPWGSLARSGAALAFGTDAPVEPIDPWPGIALAVTRRDPSWPGEARPFGASESMTLDRAMRAACLDPAVTARERDRGRLIPGQRADIVVLPAAALDDPVEPAGALATARPTLVIVDGEVVFET